MTATASQTTGRLHVVATPIGDLGDITLRAIEILKACSIIVGEEHRPTSTLLKKLGIDQSDKEIYLLNEHSKAKDIDELVALCATEQVALVSDCGTPGFSDPGADLIKVCRKKKIAVTALPGASSLMALISLSSQKLQQFLFVGFLPANKDERAQQIKKLKQESNAWVIMDTPYRLKSTLEELAREMPKHRGLLGVKLTHADEVILEGTFKEILGQCPIEVGEFMILRYKT